MNSLETGKILSCLFERSAQQTHDSSALLVSPPLTFAFDLETHFVHPESLMEYLHGSTSAMRGRENLLS